MMLSEAAYCLHGHLIGGDASFESVSIDSRTLQPGDLYVAIQGDRFDGHDFVAQAVQAGASACVIKKGLNVSDKKISIIEVADTKIALGLLASAWKKQYKPYCVAITGSSGKTSVKEMIAAILSLKGQTLATKGNFNNEIGVPLTLLRLKEADRYAVIELGASAEGEIDYTSKLVCPDVAVITNIAPAHIEGFGSIDAISRAKSEIFDGLVENGAAIINLDEPFNTNWKSKLINKNVIKVSLVFRDEADMWTDNVVIQKQGNSTFQIKSPESTLEIRLSLLGLHNVHNALLAAAAAKASGASDEHIVKGLESVKPVPGRLYPRKGVKQLRIIDDTYNANPSSVKAAIDLLSVCSDKTAIVLGDMAELGKEAVFQHEQIGAWAAKKNIKQLVAIGNFAKNTAAGFGQQALVFQHQDEAIKKLPDTLEIGATVLVKGSRSAHMENIVNALVDGE